MPEIADADDALDDADPQARRIERVALLDMRFEIAEIAAGFDLIARPAGEPGLGQRVAQRLAGVAAR